MLRNLKEKLRRLIQSQSHTTKERTKSSVRKTSSQSESKVDKPFGGVYNIIFNKNETFKNLGNNKLGNFIKKRWNNYKRWWTSEDPEQKKWIMWDLALIEAIANPEFSKINTFKTPPQNLERNIKIYTYIDSTNMKIDFWRHYNKLMNN